METKNFFDAWLATQNKMINNFSNAAQKMQEAVKSGQVAEKGSEIYKEWLNNQTEMVETAKKQSTEDFSKIADSAADTNNWYKQWADAQKKNTEKLMEMNQQFFKPFNGFNPSSAMDSFNPSKIQENMTEGYKTWLQNWSKPFEGLMGSVNNDSSKDAYKNILDSTNNYFKMYEIWMPFYKAMNTNQFSANNFSNFFNPEKFREVMDNSLKFISPAPLKDAMEQANAWMENLSSFNRHMFSGVNSQFQELNKNFSSNSFIENNPFNEVFQNLQNSFKLMTPGKQTEINEMYSSTLDLVSKYSIKTNELQYLIYTSGQKALEQIIAENAEDLSKANELTNYSAFFQKWIERSEKTFIDLFNTDEYSKLQAELIELGVEIKAKVEKLTEAALAPYPVVLRSEADDLHKTIYELKKRIKALERSSNVEETEETEKKSSKSIKRKPETV